MTDRLALLMDIARANELHSSECEFLSRKKAQAHSDMWLQPVECDCWLSRPPGQEETAPAQDLAVDCYSTEELDTAVQVLGEFVQSGARAAGLGRAAEIVLAELAELQFMNRERSK